MWSLRPAALSLLLVALLLDGGGGGMAAGAAADTSSVVPADSFLNADGLPLLMPTNRTTDGRRWLFELPRDPGAAGRAGSSLAAGRAEGRGAADRPHVRKRWPELKKLYAPFALNAHGIMHPRPCAVGTLVMLHRCGRNAEDFWPPSVRRF